MEKSKSVFEKFYTELYHTKLPSSDGYSEYRATKALKYIPKGSTILNIGCGHGYESKIFKQNGIDVIGIDVSKNIKVYADLYQIKTIITDIQLGTDLSDKSFDIIYSGETIEHLVSPTLFFNEVCRLLKPNGTLILMLPNIAKIQNRINLLLFGRISCDIEECEGHLHEMTPHQIKYYLNKYKFEIKIFTGVSGIFKFIPDLSSEFFIVAKYKGCNL